MIKNNNVEGAEHHSTATLNQRERMKAMLHEGMLAHSVSELDHMFALMQSEYSVGGGLKYIKKISSYGNADARERDAQRRETMITIIDHMFNYLEDAQQTITALTHFIHTLGIATYDQEKSLGDQVSLRQIDDPLFQRALGVITRSREMDSYVTQDHTPGRSVIDTDFMKQSGQTMQRVRWATYDQTLDSLENQASDLYVSEMKRLAFWLDQLFGYPADTESGVARRFGAVDIEKDEPMLAGAIQERLNRILAGNFPA